MRINNFIADFKAENDIYVAQGLIDDISLYKWVSDALKPFGMNIMVLQDAVVEVKGKKGILPENFYSLYAGWWCEPKGYYTTCKNKSELQKSLIWTERVEHSRKWDSCNMCCSTNEEKVITERFFIDDEQVEFYYKNPRPIKIGNLLSQNWCASDCKNKIVKSSPYEVVINSNTVYTNFEEGSLYIQYYGMELDEDGMMIIPDGAMGEIAKYVDIYLNKKLIEKIVKNKEDDNSITLFKYYVDLERDQRFRAVSASKFERLTPGSFMKLKEKNRVSMLQHELKFPII